MDSDIANLVKLAVELKEIATKNNDEFRLTIHVLPIGKDRARFELDCIETADEHSFVTSAANDLNSAVAVARAQIDSACKSWGYER